MHGEEKGFFGAYSWDDNSQDPGETLIENRIHLTKNYVSWTEETDNRIYAYGNPFWFFMMTTSLALPFPRSPSSTSRKTVIGSTKNIEYKANAEHPLDE